MGKVRDTEADKSSVRVRRIQKGIFALYLLLLLRVIVFKYPFFELAAIADRWKEGNVVREGLRSANFTLFQTIRMYVRYWGRLNSFENLFGNVLCFVPLGFGIPFFWKEIRNGWTLFCVAFCLVLAVEFFQLMTAFGAFDVDDILLNCLGAMLGYLLFRLSCRGGTDKRKG